ncbi:MAG: SpoIIE family protein phosphatase [Acidobacteriota bacterium]
MSLRAKLITAFLLLAILPLSGIVLYNYLSSLSAFRQAVEAETSELAGDIARTMDVARRDFRQRFSRIGLMELEKREAEDVETALGEAFSALGSSTEWIEAVRLIPGALAAAPPPPPEGGVSLPEPAPSPQAKALPQWMPPAGQAEEWQELIQHLSTELPKVRLEVERAFEEQARARAEAQEIAERRRAASERRRRRMERFFGDDFRSEVRSGGRLLGEVEADVSISEFLRSVLMQSQRAKGEVPFALDPDAEVVKPYTANDEDLAVLLGLTEGDPEAFSGLFTQQGDEQLVEFDDWIAVTRQDPESGIIFGIARPIADSLAQIRQTAVRNLALGTGMISLALLGILPLSTRMTRELERLMAQVDRLATGDLQARATASGRDEIGQLARSFNRMAADLEDHQEQLLQQERDAREREVRAELLAAENERRGDELEEARNFQLSLLPRALPQNDHWEVSVLMRTATEVGGDYYDFCSGAESFVATLGDAAGHGARAGTMVAVLKTLFSSCDVECRPDRFLNEAAATVRDMRLDRMTMSLVVAHCHEDRIVVSSAGMPPVLVLRDSTGEVEELQVPGLPLGTHLLMDYPVEEIGVASGDCVLLMSDGFAELPDREGDPIGYGAVVELLQQARGQSAAGVVDTLTEGLRQRIGDQAPADDVTFVALRRL